MNTSGIAADSSGAASLGDDPLHERFDRDDRERFPRLAALEHRARARMQWELRLDGVVAVVDCDEAVDLGEVQPLLADCKELRAARNARQPLGRRDQALFDVLDRALTSH